MCFFNKRYGIDIIKFKLCLCLSIDLRLSRGSVQNKLKYTIKVKGDIMNHDNMIELEFLTLQFHFYYLHLIR